MVSRSGRRTRSLPVLGRQGLVSSNFAQSERASTIAISLAAERRSRAARPGQEGQPYGQGGQPAYGQSPYGQDYGSSAYANYQDLEKKKTPIGWWIAGAALVIGIIVAVIAIRAVTGGIDTGTSGGPVGQPSQAPARRRSPRALSLQATRPTDECMAGRSPTPCSVRRGARHKARTACRSGATCRASSYPSRLTMTGTATTGSLRSWSVNCKPATAFFTPSKAHRSW